MARSNFVKPDIVQLEIGHGDFIQAKKQLTAGEERAIYAGLVRSMRPGDKDGDRTQIDLDPQKVGLTKIVAYLVGWGGPGFTDGDGKPVGLSEGNIDLLDRDVYEAIVKAIDTHEETQKGIREALKNAPDGVIDSTPISPSAA